MEFFGKIARTLWRVWLIVGVLAVLFGIAAAAWPNGTVEVLTRIFAIAVLLGAIAIGGISIWTRKVSPIWGIGVFFAIIGLVIAISALVHPNTFSLVLAMIFGLFAVISGMGNLGAGTASAVSGIGWPIIISGILQIIIGVMLLISPFTSLLAVTWFVGAVAIALGVTMLVSGFIVRTKLREAGQSAGFFDNNVIDTQ